MEATRDINHATFVGHALSEVGFLIQFSSH